MGREILTILMVFNFLKVCSTFIFVPTKLEMYNDSVKDKIVKNLIFQHIPKTGGTSFYQEMKEYYNTSFPMVSPGGNEKCFFYPHWPRKVEYVMLREPVSHVLSQYTMCRYSKWGKEKTKQIVPKNMELYEGFDYWLDNFKKSNCYHADNLQTRYLTCRKTSGHTNAGYNPNGKHDPIKNILNIKYGFGIMERYEDSLCMVLFNMGHVELPSWCFCGKGKGKKKITHGTKKHSVGDLKESTITKIKTLVKKDTELYEHAKLIFEQRFNELKRHFCN